MTHHEKQRLFIIFSSVLLLHFVFIYTLQGMTFSSKRSLPEHDTDKKHEKQLTIQRARQQQNRFRKIHIASKPITLHSAPDPLPFSFPSPPDIPTSLTASYTTPPLLDFTPSQSPIPAPPLSSSLPPNNKTPLTDTASITERLLKETVVIPEENGLKNSLSPLFLKTNQPTNPSSVFSEETGSPLNGTIARSENFLIDLNYAPSPKGGYLFSITLHSKKESAFLRIRNNLYFLIDRSHSIEKRRYETTKQAVAEALDLLNPHDRFTILVFDKEITSFAPKPVPCTVEAITEAKAFLLQQKHGGFFATTDLYASLDKIIPQEVSATEVHTAILFSDGDTFLPLEEQRTVIRNWSERNKGKVSLFSIASEEDNNLPLLDFLSVNNKGWLSYCSNNEQLNTQLARLLHTIRNPIGKELVATIIPQSDTAKITLFPRPQRLEELYEHRSYKLIGQINEPVDFTLFLQGRYYDRFFDIKHTLSFSDTKPKMYTDFLKRYTVHQAYDCYDNYLSGGRRSHINQARRLLDPLKIPVAFQ